MHQDFELLKVPSDIWVSACEKAAPFFLCWLPVIHIRKKKKKYRIQNSMVDCASYLIYGLIKVTESGEKRSINYWQKKDQPIYIKYVALFPVIAFWQNVDDIMQNLQRCWHDYIKK